jgi:predicted pyridoxine 5'-phosphate oxidase superfamily flavin-nucleotide-binding protein
MTDPTRPSMFHQGHRALQRRFDGRRVADALEKHRRLDTFRPEDVVMIEEAPFFFLATAHGGSVDCSFKGGPPGFVQVTGPTTLEWPDFDGNSMYRSLGNILKSPGVGLLFIRFEGNSTRLRVNGTAEVLYDHPRLMDFPGAKMVVRVEAREIFPNCPRYIPDLGGGTPSPYLPEAGRPLTKPDWKDRDYIRDILPERDPHRG